LALKNKVIFFKGEIGGQIFTAGALLKTLKEKETSQPSIAYKVAYAICSKKESHSKKISQGYIGARLMGLANHPYIFSIGLSTSGALIPERLAQLIRLHVELDIVSKRVPVPAKLHKKVLKGDSNSKLSSMLKNKTTNKIMKKVTQVVYDS